MREWVYEWEKKVHRVDDNPNSEAETIFFVIEISFGLNYKLFL